MVSKKIKKIINKIHLPNWLLVLLTVVFVLRIPSFFEPFSYGDELIYLTLGHGIRQGVPLYIGLHDNKPPLLYILAAISGNVFWFKAILAIWHAATVIIFWKLSKALFPRRKSLHIVSTVIFALATTLPRLEGNIANAEPFMIGPIMIGFLILLTKKLNPKNLIIAGVFFSIATLFKVPAAFDLPAIIIFWLITRGIKLKNIKKVIINSFFLAIGFLAPIILTFIWYGLKGAFNQYLIAAFLQNVGYLSSWRPDDAQLSFFVRNKPLIIRSFVVLAGIILLFWKRKKLPKPFIFITIWLLMALFATALSERPYPHYIIQAIPAISLLFGILVTEKTIIQVVALLPLSLAFFVPFYYHFWYYPTLSYYKNFTDFAFGKTTREEYFNTFNSQLNRNYKISEFVGSATKEREKVFVWGDGVSIYALSRRLPPIKYVADYHIKDFSTNQEVIEGLTRNPPVLIIILPDSPEFSELDAFLGNNYKHLTKIENANIWKLDSP